MRSMRLAVLAFGLVCGAPRVSAADQAVSACTSNDAARTIAGCTQLLNRRGLSPRNRAIIYRNRGVAFMVKGELERARSDFTSAIRSDPGYPKAYVDRAELLKSLNKYVDAAKDYEFGLALAARMLPPQDDYLIAAELDLGQLYSDLNRSEDAQALFERVLAAQEKVRGIKSERLAAPLVFLAEVADKKGNYAEAERFAKRALSVLPDPESRMAGFAIHRLATIYSDELRFRDAEDMSLRAVAIDAKVSGKSSADYAASLGTLANLYVEVGRFADAERLALESKEIFQNALGPEDISVAKALSNLSSIYKHQRRFNEAEAALKRALVIEEHALGLDNSQLASTLSNIGGVLFSEGRNAEAEALFVRSLSICAKNGGSNSIDAATYLTNLALTVAKRGDVAEAIRLSNQSLAIQEKIFGPNSVRSAPTLLFLADQARVAGRTGEAIAFLDRVLATIRASQAGPGLLESVRERQGAIAMSGGHFAEAEARFKEALVLLEQAFGREHPDAIKVLENLAKLAAKRLDLHAALDLLRRAESIAARSSATRDPESAASLRAAASKNFASTAWQLAATGRDEASALLGETFVAAQRTQLGTAAAAVTQMAARFGVGNSQVAAAVREQQDMSAQARALAAKLNAALGATDARKRTEVALTALRGEIAAVEARRRDLTARIDRDFPQYVELASPKPLTIAETQALLRSDEALVTWLIFDKEMLVFAVTREGGDWHRVDLGEKNLEEMVARLRAGLDFDRVSRGLASGKPGRDIVFNLATAHALYEKLLGPVQGLVGAKKNLVVIPAGALTSLPLQVLVTEPPKRAATSLSDSAYRQAAWLAKRHAITVLPSVTALRALRTFAKPSQAAKPLVGFADPVFGRGKDGTPARGPSARTAEVGAYSRFFRGSEVDVDVLRSGLPALPETADELRAVAGELHAANADLKFGEAASVTEVKALPLDQYRVVYFATHGLVAGEVKGLTEPALALTIPAHPTEADSGLLTASDVAQLKLDADWVVLSACNTAVGETPGAEGLSGLARAFFYAGARALLVSHWPVQSNAAVNLTTHTFAALAADPKLGRSEALRRSMLALIATGGDNAYPATWAPFVVVGEDRG